MLYIPLGTEVLNDILFSVTVIKSFFILKRALLIYVYVKISGEGDVRLRIHD